MLNEIMEAINHEVSHDEIMHVIRDSVDMTNSVYVKIPLDRKVDKNDFLFVEAELLETDLEKVEWFKERQCYSRYINVNKAVLTARDSIFIKKVESCHKYALIFRMENLQKKKIPFDISSLNTMVNDHLKATNAIDDTELHFLYLNNIPYIIEIIDEYINLLKSKSKKAKPKVQINIFVDADIEEYEKLYDIYMNDYIIGKDKKNHINIDGKIVGRCNEFYTLNSDKPLLSYMLPNKQDEIHLVTKKEGSKLYKYRKYMSAKHSQKILMDIGSIQYGGTIQNYEYVINSYVNNPYQIIEDLPSAIYIKNILNVNNAKEIVLYKYSDISIYIMNSLLYGDIKGYNNQGRTLENTFKTFEYKYSEILKNLGNSSFQYFKERYNQLFYDMLRLYTRKDNIYKVINIINFHVCMQDYLFKTNIKEGVAVNVDKIRENIIQQNSVYNIESNDEFYILCGQLVKYIKSKSTANNKTNRMYHEYFTCNTTAKLISIINRDYSRISHSVRMGNKRSDALLVGISQYYNNHISELKRVDMIQFNIGLYYGECLLYTSNKNKENISLENKKGENENEK